ncbi:YciI family protein [Allohahella marinimesophila]|uniref:YciI family protein n=1 Tax=Allohahella marinimesophila TaxID=1054972 RepID=A0ABP7PI85_9GAMM
MRYLIIAMRTPEFQQSAIEPHKQYLAQLKRQGSLELTGPFTDKSGGAYLITAENLESAQAIAFDDPIHKSGSSVLTVYEWDAS